MAKKVKPPEPAGESAPMWIVSFADLVTLLMSFFVVLFALKQGGVKQQTVTAAAIKAAFDPTYEPPIEDQSEFAQAFRHFRGMPGPPTKTVQGQASQTAKGNEGPDPEVETVRPGKDIVTGGKILFAPGETQLSASALAAVKEIADKVRGLNNVLMIKGHVSADELSQRSTDSAGMLLSYQRATAVAEALADIGIDRRVLRPVACGAFEPLKVGVYDAQGMQANRRVEIFTTDYTASDYFPTQTVSPATHAATVPATQGTDTAPASRP